MRKGVPDRHGCIGWLIGFGVPQSLKLRNILLLRQSGGLADTSAGFLSVNAGDISETCGSIWIGSK
jgi:hypothetical protein